MTTPNVAFIGRVNVGKSTLFNRLTERKLALVSPTPGTTRDRREAEISWRGQKMVIVDTGGVEEPGRKKRPSEKDTLQPLITAQTEQALEGADFVVLVVSAEDGVMPQDEAWAQALRGKPAMVVVNKVDNRQREDAIGEFYALGLGDPVPVSAISGRGSGDLLDLLLRRLKKLPKRKTEKKPLREADASIAILGQPNSGKSSLLNAILGEERVVVSPIPHTTREPIDTYLTYDKKKLRLIDTAGIRRRSHVTVGVEAQGVHASLGTAEEADVVLLVFDVKRGPTLQDQRLGRLVQDRGRGLVLVVNKWDLVGEKTPTTMKEVERVVRNHLPGLGWAPIVFVSAKTGQRVHGVLDQALVALASRDISLDEETLSAFLSRTMKKHRPIRGGGVRHPTILSFKQTSVRPPRFEINVRGELHPSYLKFLENQLRQEFAFVGSPIQIDLKTKRKKIQK